MDNEYVKKLTGKNNKDFEFAAAHIINNCDIDAFSALVEKSDFLFDFIKENVKKRLANVITNYNYKNLLCFLKVYSSDYEEFIISTLVRFADEELTDEMLDKLENGTEDEKAYSAKYFSFINDTIAIDLLRKHSYSGFDALAINCAEALSAMKDEESYNLALEKLKSEDEFEKLAAVKFLCAFKDQRALANLFETLKNSSMSENIASEIPYLQSFLELLDTEYKSDTILAINYVLNGLGEFISLAQIFDFQLFEIFDRLINLIKLQVNGSETAVLLLNAKQKFEQLTENDEYLFDEDKTTKEEVYEVKNLLNSQPDEFWDEQIKLLKEELNEDSKMVFFALELVLELNLTDSMDKLKELLNSKSQTRGQTIILKTVEVIKSLGKLNEIDKDSVLKKISDENIKLIIQSLF